MQKYGFIMRFTIDGIYYFAIYANQELNVVMFYGSYHFVQELYFTRFYFVHFVYAT